LITSPRVGSSSTTSPTPRVRVPQHVARLVARLVVDNFASRRAARHRQLRPRRASGCLGTSCGSSSTTLPTSRVRVPRHVARLVARLGINYFPARRATTSPTPRVRVPRHVERLVVDYFAACRMARRRLVRVTQARRRLLHPHRASECLGTSRGSSSTTCHIAARLLVGRSH
jgi:hypothetical protein